MKPSPLRDRSAAFAKDIVFAVRALRDRHVESILLNQLLRCGTSIGANIHEAQFAQGSRDFISKLEISLKECNESDYWLTLLRETDSIDETLFNSLISQCAELRKMLISSINTMKARQSGPSDP
jgi:four helix bundle protein